MRLEVYEFMKRTGLKQLWIAEKIGVSPQHFNMYLRNRRNLSTSKLQQLKQLMNQLDDIISI